jgi:lipopolysaccharide/colanic/teichoic acid biosynthesis glycosyltransferase
MIANDGINDELFDSEVQSTEIHPSVNHACKRLIDITGAVIGLSITVFLFIPIGLAIFCESPGPILFRQRRVGFQGQEFLLWKFRSMIPEAERLKHIIPNQANGHMFKNDNDPRITRVGRFLRYTSLDEFPQFWNVLTGAMSLVGTRPPTPDEVKQYAPHHWRRLNVKPGITGEWQVSGRSTIKDFEDVVKLDLDYQKKWSVFYDLKIIAKTVIVVLLKHGAY